MVFSRRTRGACSALAWNEAERRYRCALVSHPSDLLPARWRWAGPLLARLARRFISADTGCDSSAVSHPA
jgi:hypothetical protein